MPENNIHGFVAEEFRAVRDAFEANFASGADVGASCCGTLDGETLEVVATTLETLAQGNRMVGVVTHVTALAERVPVRYRVSRNARTSIVAREGLAVVDEEELTA